VAALNVGVAATQDKADDLIALYLPDLLKAQAELRAIVR
jgi:hypothetical protein